MAILEHHSSDLLHFLLNLGDCSVEDFDKKLSDVYGISFENFHKLIKDLTPLCDRNLTKRGVICGFRGENGWIVKDEFTS